MQAQEHRYYSTEEYLQLETAAEYKSEYYEGQILPMAGASVNHNRLALNLSTALNTILEDQEYEVFMNDMRLWIPKNKLYTYPDVMVVFGQLEFLCERNDTITNPLMIAEVLSDSTEKYDRGKKFEFYRHIPSFQEYILIDQYRIYVEQFTKTANGKWLLSEYKDINPVLSLVSVQLEIPLSSIYKKVKF